MHTLTHMIFLLAYLRHVINAHIGVESLHGKGLAVIVQHATRTLHVYVTQRHSHRVLVVEEQRDGLVKGKARQRLGGACSRGGENRERKK